MLRAPQLPAATSPPFLNTTFVEPARSAEPPISSGSFDAMAFSTLPDAARVACASVGANVGRSPAGSPAGGPPRRLGSEAGGRRRAARVALAPVRLEARGALPRAAARGQRRRGGVAPLDARR